jgi:proteic killer suppression protein
MIISFRDRITEAVFHGATPKGLPSDLVNVTRRKLRYLNAATELGDLKAPPGNRLEALKADRAGQHSGQAKGLGTLNSPTIIEWNDFGPSGNNEWPGNSPNNSRPCTPVKFSGKNF